MDFFDVVRRRRSIRAFKSQPVEAEKLQRLLESLNQAPSAGNLQAYEVYLLRNAERRSALMKAAADQEFVAQAPLVLVFCTHGTRAEARYGERGTGLYTLQDATIACTYAMLAAAALGLATAWVGKFDEQAVQEVVGIPPEQRPVALLPIGYAAESPHAPQRRALADLIHEVG
jgi:nitroreductase